MVAFDVDNVGIYFIGFLVVVVILLLFAITIPTQAEPSRQAMRPEGKKEGKVEEGKGEEEAQTLDL
jgi:hypothetical protein